MKSASISWLFAALLSFSSAVILTPEDIDFALHRCQNISTGDTLLQLKWASWEFPNNHQTHCYVKCFLYKLGLIELKSRGLDVIKFMKLYDFDYVDYNKDNNLFDLLEEPLSGTCESYYLKWMEILQTYNKSFRKIFYVSKADRDEYYKRSPLHKRQYAKIKGMTAIEFCNAMKKKIDMCYLLCIFQHFHYIDLYGRVDKSEVLQSFYEARRYDNKDLMKAQACVHNANRQFSLGLCHVAKELYKCFMTEIKEFRYIVTIRDRITEYY